MRVKTSVCCSSKSDLCKCLYRNVSDFAVHACTCVCVLKCPCGRARNTAGGKIWHWSLACSLRGSAATHTHTHDPETHFDLHHLVWSARPRAWQLMINISPRPLPSQLRVHANAHVQNEIHLLFLVHVLYTCSLCVTHTPSLPSQAVSVVGQLAGSLNWCFWHCAVTARAPLYPPIPASSPTSPCPAVPATSSSLLEIVTCRILCWPQVKKLNHLISEDFLGRKGIFVQLLGFLIDPWQRRLPKSYTRGKKSPGYGFWLVGLEFSSGYLWQFIFIAI